MTIRREMVENALVLEDTDSGKSVEIRETMKDGRMHISPRGDLTGDVAHDLEDELTSVALSCRDLVLDMSEVTDVSNSVIRMMLDVQHIVDSVEGNLALRGMNEKVISKFEEMGLEAVFDIEE